MSSWRAFWAKVLTPVTARFILALIALAMAQYAMHKLMSDEIRQANRDALMLALGIVLGLSKDVFGYYFGSTARGDDGPSSVQIDQPANMPVPVEEQH